MRWIALAVLLWVSGSLAAPLSDQAKQAQLKWPNLTLEMLPDRPVARLLCEDAGHKLKGQSLQIQYLTSGIFCEASDVSWSAFLDLVVGYPTCDRYSLSASSASAIYVVGPVLSANRDKIRVKSIQATSSGFLCCIDVLHSEIACRRDSTVWAVLKLSPKDLPRGEYAIEIQWHQSGAGDGRLRTLLAQRVRVRVTE
jgi:hypothetical protein